MSIDTEAQGYAMEAIWQFVPEVAIREDDNVLLTPSQVETVLRRMGWVPPSEQRTIDTERSVAIREAHEIEQADAYFKARPQLESLHNRRIFESGFRRGWDTFPIVKARLAPLVYTGTVAPGAAHLLPRP